MNPSISGVKARSVSRAPISNRASTRSHSEVGPQQRPQPIFDAKSSVSSPSSQRAQQAGRPHRTFRHTIASSLRPPSSYSAKSTRHRCDDKPDTLPSVPEGDERLETCRRLKHASSYRSQGIRERLGAHPQAVCDQRDEVGRWRRGELIGRTCPPVARSGRRRRRRVDRSPEVKSVTRSHAVASAPALEGCARTRRLAKPCVRTRSEYAQRHAVGGHPRGYVSCNLVPTWH